MSLRGGLPFVDQHHRIIDDLSVHLGTMVTPKLLRDGVETPPFVQHLSQTDVLDFEGLSPGSIPVRIDTHAGVLDGGVRIATELTSDRPTVVFHHGIGEVPPHASFRRLFTPETPAIDANLIAIEAPYHDSLTAFTTGTRSLDNLLSMQAASVTVIEALNQRLGEQIDTPIIVSGLSLGGFVTNLHHIYHGSADRYIPLLAGLAMDDVFIESVYRHGVASNALSATSYLRQRLNFEAAFAGTDPAGVHPMLAKYDRVVRYPVQSASYNGRPIATIEGGHLTGSVAMSRFRSHIERFVEREATKCS